MTTSGATGRWTEGDVDANGVRIHFHRTGEGELPAVVLAHGFSDNGLCWRRTAEVLETDFDVVMVDARNHGKSGTATGGLAEMADDLAAVITRLSLDRPAVVGHSMGAAAAAELAARYPMVLSRLVLEDPPWNDAKVESDRSAQRRRDGIRNWLMSLTEMSTDEIEKLGLKQHPEWEAADRPDWMASKQQVRPEAADSLGQITWTHLIDRITCPTLLVHGEPERGGLLTPNLAGRLAEMNPLITVSSIENAGHNIRRENFQPFIASLSRFLRHP